MKLDAGGGGGYNPAGWLFEPVAEEPVPSTFDAALNMASWLSLGHWALVALDQADGSFDLQEKAQTWLVGDWEHVAVAAGAMRQLKKYCDELADGVDDLAGPLDVAWDGNASLDASITLASQTTAYREAGRMLEIAAKGYEDVASGLYGVAKDVGGFVEALIDLLIATGISLAATAAGSWTLVVGAIGAAATAYNISQIVKTIGKIVSAIEGAMTFVTVFADSVKATLGSAGDWHLVDIPAPFENRTLNA